MTNNTPTNTADFAALRHAFETETARLEPFLGTLQAARSLCLLKLLDGLSVSQAKRALMEAYRAVDTQTRISAHELSMSHERTVFVDETTPQEDSPQAESQDTPPAGQS